MDEPQAEQLVETLDHCGAPRAAGGADTSQAWYQLRARKRDTFADALRGFPSKRPHLSESQRLRAMTRGHTSGLGFRGWG